MNEISKLDRVLKTLKRDKTVLCGEVTKHNPTITHGEIEDVQIVTIFIAPKVYLSDPIKLQSFMTRLIEEINETPIRIDNFDRNDEFFHFGSLYLREQIGTRCHTVKTVITNKKAVTINNILMEGTNTTNTELHSLIQISLYPDTIIAKIAMSQYIDSGMRLCCMSDVDFRNYLRSRKRLNKMENQI